MCFLAYHFSSHVCSLPSLKSTLLDLKSVRNSRMQRLRVGAYNLLHLLLILKDQERRHGSDAQLLCHIRDLIDVELDEVRAGEFVGEPIIQPLLAYGERGE